MTDMTILEVRLMERKQSNLIDLLIAHENAKRACEPAAIKARTEAKCRELFGSPEEMKAKADAMCRDIFAEVGVMTL